MSAMARRSFGLLALTMFALWVGAGTASAQGRVSTFGLFEGWGYPRLPGHPAIMAAWEVEKLKHGAAAAVEYNTDTLTLEYVGHRLTNALTVGGACPW